MQDFVQRQRNGDRRQSEQEHWTNNKRQDRDPPRTRVKECEQHAVAGKKQKGPQRPQDGEARDGGAGRHEDKGYMAARTGSEGGRGRTHEEPGSWPGPSRSMDLQGKRTYSPTARFISSTLPRRVFVRRVVRDAASGVARRATTDCSCSSTTARRFFSR